MPRSYRIISVTVALLLNVIFLAGCEDLRNLVGEKTTWSDVVVSLDGREIAVARSVSYDPPRKGSPYIHEIEFTHPNSGEKVTWRGRRGGEYPVALQVTNNASYLVVLVGGLTLAPWGCPAVPYLAFKRTIETNQWLPIELRYWPSANLIANLQKDVPRFWVHVQGQYSFSPERIRSLNELDERATSWYFQSAIPRSANEWKYMYKSNGPRCNPEPPSASIWSFAPLLPFMVPTLSLPIRLLALLVPSIRRRSYVSSLAFYFLACAVQVAGLVYLWLYGAGQVAAYVFMAIAVVAFVPLAIGILVDIVRGIRTDA